MRSFLRILQYIRKYSGLAILNVVFNLLAVVFSLVSLTMIMPFLTLLFDKTPPRVTEPELEFSIEGIIGFFNYYFSHLINDYGRLEALVFVCGVVVIVFLLKNLFRYLALFVLAPIRYGVVRDIREKLYNQILVLPLSYYSEERKGDIITRMTSDVQEVEWGIMSTLEVTVREPITIITYLGAMLYISPGLTLFVLAMLLFTGLIIGRIGKSLKKKSSMGQSKLGDILSIIDETLVGLRIVKAFTAEEYQRKKFRRENQSYFKVMTQMLHRRDLSSPLSEFLAISIIVIVLYYGGRLVLSDAGGLDAATFIGFMLIFSQLIPPAKSFSSAFYHIQKGLASSERIDELLDAPITLNEKPDARDIKGFQKQIVYHQVAFSYDKKRVLEDINLTINKGKMVAIVGQSGAGKSTLVDLLPRFYDPIQGSITIDEVDIRDCKLADLRNLMGVVSQDSILFNDTVYNNIAFGTETTMDRVMEAAQIANAHDFIIKLKNGYDTVIGEMGNKLSGGEKQRLTIARAILANPPILIMDEATSSLDTESEKLVQDAIYKLMQNRTSVVIAHRLSTIQFADEIIVMSGGKIIEKGNHIGLMARNGSYKRLVELQAF